MQARRDEDGLPPVGPPRPVLHPVRAAATPPEAYAAGAPAHGNQLVNPVVASASAAPGASLGAVHPLNYSVELADSSTDGQPSGGTAGGGGGPSGGSEGHAPAAPPTMGTAPGVLPVTVGQALPYSLGFANNPSMSSMGVAEAAEALLQQPMLSQSSQQAAGARERAPALPLGVVEGAGLGALTGATAPASAGGPLGLSVNVGPSASAGPLHRGVGGGLGTSLTPAQAAHQQTAIHLSQAQVAAAAVAQVSANGGAAPGAGAMSGAASAMVSGAAAGASAGGGAGGQGIHQVQQFQRLKVEDALSYLDQVKLRFGNQPQVYNDFLDIMKEFKSQAIDTPGVISRVSTLFQGHPELIVGFNTFLPPGYKIEVVEGERISVLQPGQPSVSLSQLTQGVGPHGSASSSSSHLGPSAMGPTEPGSHDTNHHAYHHGARGTGPPPGGAAGGAVATETGSGGQPMEFNHAITYVNKIKNRFQGRPDVYKNFLEILHTYQKEQKNMKEGMMAPGYSALSEKEVYSKVATLFSHQEDLLSEFGQFLPDANNAISVSKTKSELKLVDEQQSLDKKASLGAGAGVAGGATGTGSSAGSAGFHKSSSGGSGLGGKGGSGGSSVGGHVRRPSLTSPPPSKKIKSIGLLRGVSLAEATKHGTLDEFGIFDKMRKLCRSTEAYDNLLRFAGLYTDGVLSKHETFTAIQACLPRNPELTSRLRDLMGYRETKGSYMEGGGHKERVSSELAMEIDYATCKKLGASYRGLPQSQTPPKCSGRTALCREVLNDVWVSFPTWSEDSTFVTSKKTSFEENIYRVEDERFELDMVIEANAETMKMLEGMRRKFSRMSSDEAAKVRLDDNLDGSSEVIYKVALERLYGDKAPDFIEGLKSNPVIAVPMILRRVKSKDEEWRDAQRQFNKIWAETSEKYYMKSLDYQGSNFKASDVKMLRQRALVNEAETALDEQKVDSSPSNMSDKPHLRYRYADAAVVSDALGLIIHHVRRQPNVQKEDKRRIKEFLRHSLQDMLGMERHVLSEDEEEDEGDGREEGGSKDCSDTERASHPRAAKSDSNKMATSRQQEAGKDRKRGEDDSKIPPATSKEDMEVDEDYSSDVYSLFYANNMWYSLLRLHHILCDRLHFIKRESNKIASDEKLVKDHKPNTTALALRLKSSSVVDPAGYYSYFLDMVRNLLDGVIDSNTFEDTLREFFGVQAYIGFTLDKVVVNIVKQLMAFVADDVCQSAVAMFRHHYQRGAAGGGVSSRCLRVQQEMAYQKKAEQLFTDENCYKIVIYKESGEMQITLLPGEGSEPGDDPRDSQKYEEYMSQYVGDRTEGDWADSADGSPKGRPGRKPVCLARCVRRGKAQQAVTLSKYRAAVQASPLPGAGNPSPTSWDCRNFRNAKRQRDSDEDSMGDSEEIKIAMGTMKMTHVRGSDCCFYKAQCLKRAKVIHSRVSLTKHEALSRWRAKWQKRHVSEAQSEATHSWFVDGPAESRDCDTAVYCDNSLAKTPYHPYNRYKVTYFPEESTPAPTPPPTTAPPAATATFAPASVSGSCPVSSDEEMPLDPSGSAAPSAGGRSATPSTGAATPSVPSEGTPESGALDQLGAQ